MAVPQERLRVAEPPGAPALVAQGLRVSWGGVWSGFLLAIGTMLLLASLGVAIGISTIDPGAGAPGRGLGIGTAIWAGLTLLVAVFVGGLIAARLGLVFDTVTSALHGALVWVLSTLAVLYMATAGISLGVNTLLGVGGAAAAGAGGIVADLTSGDVNQILTRLDDPVTAGNLAAATGIPVEEVRRMLADVRGRVEAAQSDPARAIAAAREGLGQLAARAVPAARMTSWIAFGALLVSLIAAVAGAVWGGRLAARRLRPI